MGYRDYDLDPRQRDIVRYFQDLGLTGHPRFYKLLATCALLHADKNSDYAVDEDPFSNFRECEQFDIPIEDGLVTRITDKDSRFKKWLRKWRRLRPINHLLTTDQLAQFAGYDPPLVEDLLKVKDESIPNTLLDRAVYTVILAVVLEELGA